MFIYLFIQNFVKMRMLAIWEAREMMERGVAERDFPSGCLGWVVRRRQTACLTREQVKEKNSQGI
jgi:hypothetical protein